MEKALTILAQSIARAGPEVGGMILIFGFMVWLGSSRRTGRDTDKIILLAGLLILAVLATGLLVETWKGV